jgi:hypothetical protein
MSDLEELDFGEEVNEQSEDLEFSDLDLDELEYEPVNKIKVDVSQYRFGTVAPKNDKVERVGMVPKSPEVALVVPDFVRYNVGSSDSDSNEDAPSFAYVPTRPHNPIINAPIITNPVTTKSPAQSSTNLIDTPTILDSILNNPIINNNQIPKPASQTITTNLVDKPTYSNSILDSILNNPIISNNPTPKPASQTIATNLADNPTILDSILNNPIINNTIIKSTTQPSPRITVSTITSSSQTEWTMPPYISFDVTPKFYFPVTPAARFFFSLPSIRKFSKRENSL